jgi:hypothetical protein
MIVWHTTPRKPWHDRLIKSMHINLFDKQKDITLYFSSLQHISGRNLIVKDNVNNGVAFLSHLNLTITVGIWYYK